MPKSKARKKSFNNGFMLWDLPSDLAWKVNNCSQMFLTQYLVQFIIKGFKLLK